MAWEPRKMAGGGAFDSASCDSVLRFAAGVYPSAPCVLVGGCVRDLLLGVEASGVIDWDVFFLGGCPRELREAFAGYRPPGSPHWNRSRHLIAAHWPGVFVLPIDSK